MANGELNHSLVPLLVAGILSGSLSAAFLRPQGAGGTNPRADSDTLPEPERVTVAESASWITDLDPVLDVLGAALVTTPSDSAEQIAVRTLVNTGEPAAGSDEVRSALVTVRNGLDAAASDVGTCSALNRLTAAAATLARFVVTASDSDAKSGRHVAAKAVLDEYRGWRSLADLASRVSNGTPGSRLSYHVDFIIATIPDYVDSNSGWLADQALGAIQSSTARVRQRNRADPRHSAGSTSISQALSSSGRSGLLKARRGKTNRYTSPSSCRSCCWCSKPQPPACTMRRCETPRRSSGPGDAALASPDASFACSAQPFPVRRHRWRLS